MTRILTIIALLFGTPAWANETIMECNGNVYRYSEGFFRDAVDVRLDGEWKRYQLEPTTTDWAITKQKTKVKDFAHIYEIVSVRSTDDDVYPKGTINKSKIVLDFQFCKCTETKSYSNKLDNEEFEYACRQL